MTNREITELILHARDEARRESTATAAPELAAHKVHWPVQCTVGPGLEGAIACETRVGYVNGSRGQLVYRGYDIFDLCAYSTFEEVCYLLLYGRLPTATQLAAFQAKLISYRNVPHTLRRLMGFDVEHMHPMAALRLGTNLMRQRMTWIDRDDARPATAEAIAADEDSIPMETPPLGERHAIYEFKRRSRSRPGDITTATYDPTGLEACLHLISAMATLTAAIKRVREDTLPINPDPELGHAANFLYMMTGQRPTREEARVMDIALILHADHGMNASTFASMVVASTLSDFYFSVGSGIAALSGPLHGGANEEVLKQLEAIGSADRVKPWLDRTLRNKGKIMGMGHRVYKTYDPRARVLSPLASYLIEGRETATTGLLQTARALESQAVAALGESKGIFPNVDFYSGLVYKSMGIPRSMFTPVFAVSRVAGWTARLHEYLRNNRIFRPRAIYAGGFDNTYVPIDQR